MSDADDVTDGQDRFPGQAARIRVPLVRDLRRPRLVLRLRPLRRPAEGQHQAALALGDGAGARRHRRAGLVDHPPPAGLGGIRPRRRIHRSARRLQVLQEALPRRSSRGVAVRPASEQAARRDVRLRPHRGAPLQPHVRDARRRARGDGRPGVPAPRDGAGHLHQLQERRPDRAPQAAVRHRADRQVVPQRDHAGQLHLPHARVRADGDGVLRPAGRGRRVVPLLGAGALRLAPPLRPPREPPPHPPARRRRALPLLERDERHRVPVPDRLVGARGRGEPRRLRSHRAHERVRDEARVGRAGRLAATRRT